MHREWNERTGSTSTGTVITIAALVVVLGLVAVAALRVFADDRADDERVGPAVVPSLASPSKDGSPESPSLAAIDPRTGAEVPLPDGIRTLPSLAHDLQVSPDGSRVTFVADGDIYVAGVDGSDTRVLVGDSTDGALSPSWSPDGRRIVYAGDGAINVVDVVSGETDQVLQTKRRVWRPSFSADGGTILFTATSSDGLQLRTLPVSGGSSELLRRGAFGVYSPDGRLVAFRRTDYDGSDPTEMTEGAVWVADADGANAHRLGAVAASMSQGDPMRLWPSWAPDGRSIAYERLLGAGVRVDVLTGERRRIGGWFDPTWFDGRTLIVETD
jgi:Tol biopolymer transport system component